MTNEISRRTYVVTGASSGIGAATVDVLRDGGHRVIGADLTDSEISADLSTAEGRQRLWHGVDRLSGGVVDGVIACAGLGTAAPLTVAVNYFGMVASIELLRPQLVNSPAPRAVGIASLAAIHEVDDLLVQLMVDGDEGASHERAAELAADDTRAGLIYGSTKLAFARWIRTTAASGPWAGSGIPLNCIAPGIVLTPMTRPLLDTSWRQDIEVGAPMPLNGMMDPVVPARLLAYLAGADNSHICGQIIFVDSGAEVTLRPERPI